VIHPKTLLISRHFYSLESFVWRSMYNLKIDTISTYDIPLDRSFLKLWNGIRHVMPSTDRRLELKEKTSMAQNAWQAFVYASGLIVGLHVYIGHLLVVLDGYINNILTFTQRYGEHKKFYKKSSFLSFGLFVRPSAWNNSVSTGNEIRFWAFFANLSRKFEVSLLSDKNNGYFTWRSIYVYDISLNSSLEWENCKENQNKHFIFSKIFSENRAVYEKMWKSVEEPNRPQMTV